MNKAFCLFVLISGWMLCLKLQSCKEVVDPQVEKACQKGIEKAKRQIGMGGFSVYLPGLPKGQEGYARELFQIYYGKKVFIRNLHVPRMCGEVSDPELEKCYNNYMDSAVIAFGKDVFQRVKAGADSFNRVDPERYAAITLSPEFPGGDTAMHRILQENIHYPPLAKKERIQGKVFIEIRVDSMGKVVNTSIAKSVRYDLDSAARAGVMKLPDFLPPIHQGRKRPSKLTIPILFKLD